MSDEPVTAKEVKYDQPTSAPTPKVAAAGISGLVVTALVLIAGAAGVTLPANFEDNIVQVVAGVTALTTLINFVVAYFKRDKKSAETVRVIKGGN